MVSRKYVRDYKLEESLGPLGGIKTTPVYVGPPFRIVRGGAELLKTKRLAAAAAAVFWLAWLLALLFDSEASHTLYVVVPFACAALPAVFMTEHIITLLRHGELLTRQNADAIGTKLPTDAFAASVITGASLLARLVSALLGVAFKGGDWGFCLFAAAACAASYGMFALRGRVKTAEDK